MALFRSKNRIKRAMFVVWALFTHMNRRSLLREAFSKTFLSITVAVCKAAIPTQEKNTFFNFGCFFSYLRNNLFDSKVIKQLPRKLLKYFLHFHLIKY